jgi:hypothetical protein
MIQSLARRGEAERRFEEDDQLEEEDYEVGALAGSMGCLVWMDGWVDRPIACGVVWMDPLCGCLMGELTGGLTIKSLIPICGRDGLTTVCLSNQYNII